MKTCNECPFNKKSIPGFLADYTPKVIHDIVMSEQHFPCHKTLPAVNTLTPQEALEFPRCKGSIMYMKKGCKLPNDKNLFNDISKEDLDEILSIPEFFNHHKKD
jgi:hypothetical protein